MLDKNGENGSDTEQRISVKHFQFHIQKETGCASRTKIPTSTSTLVSK